MIFPTKHKNQANSQRGVTMLLAILVLSSITAIAFSLATVIFIEIRTSGDVVRTEPTLYASQAITEEALFKVKRGIADCPGSTCLAYDNSLNGVVLNSPGPSVQYYSPSPLIEVFKPNSTKVYEIVDPTNVFGGANYGKVSITYLSPSSGVAVSVTVDQIDPTSGNRTASFATADLNTATPSATFNLTPSMQYEMTIQNSNQSTSATISVDTYKNDGSTAQGLPYVGQTVLDITASFSGLTRKYEVKIPDQ